MKKFKFGKTIYNTFELEFGIQDKRQNTVFRRKFAFVQHLVFIQNVISIFVSLFLLLSWLSSTITKRIFKLKKKKMKSNFLKM
jgi:hypothetical protein